jgi:transcription elongation GreA/GreB family factor
MSNTATYHETRTGGWRSDKTELLQAIIGKLSHDLEVLFTAAKTAHEAATDEENAPDNKYDTLALEASYVAQGQANRAHQIRKSIELYRQLKIHESHDSAKLASVVTLEHTDGTVKTLFIGPAEGGLKIKYFREDIVVITPVSPMGRELLGKSCGDTVTIMSGDTCTEYEIIELF